jgi:hypothetical protein
MNSKAEKKIAVSQRSEASPNLKIESLHTVRAASPPNSKPSCPLIHTRYCKLMSMSINHTPTSPSWAVTVTVSL